MNTRVSTAPSAARNLVKSLSFVRKSISEQSKREERGEPNLRELFTQKFVDAVENANQAILDTESVASDFERASIIHEKGAKLEAIGKASTLARCAAMLGVQSPDLAALCRDAGSRANEAVSRAQNRMDDNYDSIRATTLLGQFLEELPLKNYDVKSDAIIEIRSRYQTHMNSAREAKNDR